MIRLVEKRACISNELSSKLVGMLAVALPACVCFMPQSLVLFDGNNDKYI